MGNKIDETNFDSETDVVYEGVESNIKNSQFGFAKEEESEKDNVDGYLNIEIEEQDTVA